MTNTLKHVKVPHAYMLHQYLWVPNYPQAPNFTLFHSRRPATSELQAILRQVRRMTPKWPCTKVSHMSQLPPPPPKYHSVSLYSQTFLSLPILTQGHRMTPKWPSTLKGSTYTTTNPFCSTSVLGCMRAASTWHALGILSDILFRLGLIANALA